MSRRPHSLLALGLALGATVVPAALAPAPAAACGPEFPNRLLLSPDAVLLSAPVADFARELGRLVPASKQQLPVLVAYDDRQKTLDIESEDLDRALNAAGAAPEQRAAAVKQLTKAREAKDPKLLDGLEPADIREYARGAILYARGEVTRAQGVWRALLELPADQRPRRSVWAAYMLGRSHGPAGGFGCAGSDDPACDVDASLKWLKRTRELARAGFEDRLGLASTSFGWEAKIELDRGGVEAGYQAYIHQAANGDPSGVNSLMRITNDVLKDPARLAKAAASPVVRPVVTALLLSRPSYAYSSADPDVTAGERGVATRWLEAVEREQPGQVAGADRLAWLAYRVGLFDKAKRWLDLADGDGPITLWTRAKLALRDGDQATGAKLLSEVVGAFAEEERWTYWPGDWRAWGAWDSSVQPRGRARGELALLELSRGEYVRSLDLLLRSDYGLDAAYLAERVVTLDELKTLVDARWPVPPPADEPLVATPQGYTYGAVSAAEVHRSATVWIRYLLGRRLVRAGRLDEAAAYLPTVPAGHEPRYGRVDRDGPAEDSPAGLLTRYRAALKTARDRKQSDAVRAMAWWEAAKITRHDGMELMGTEVGPDWQIYSGNFSLVSAAEEREGVESTLAPAKRGELRLAARYAPRPDKRWHYRYIAGDYVMNAVKLLPKTSDEAAVMLCHGAKWVINRDPSSARRFYQEYLRRRAHVTVSVDVGRDCPPEP